MDHTNHMEIQLCNQLLIIDDEDLDLIWQSSWHIEKGRYFKRWNANLKHAEYMHRVILKYDGLDDVDHINHNTFDNRKINLRIVPHHINSRNRKGLQSNNSSGVNGVRWRPERGTWQAYTMFKRKQISLGCFSTLEQAVAARKAFDEKFAKGLFQ